MKDYEKHVWDQCHYDDNKIRSWCGEELDLYFSDNSRTKITGGEWVFMGANHAALSLKQGMTTQPCQECIKVIIKELSKEFRYPIRPAPPIEDQP